VHVDIGSHARFTELVGDPVRRRVEPAALLVLVSLLFACGSGSTSGERRESATPSGDSSSPATSLSGTFTTNGRSLFIECWGEGEPTMVLEVGEGRLHEDMAALRAVYESQLRVCSYDRANKGRSSDAPTPRTGADLVADLHGLLAAAEVPGPYVLVGHSAGGLVVQGYAAVHPDELAGVVALNPVPPWKQWSSLAFEQMTPLERRDETRYLSGANGESLNYRDISHLVARHSVPPDLPFRMVISTAAQCPVPDSVCSRTYPAYEQIMKQVTGQWEQGRFTEVEATHEIHSDATSAVRAAIDDVLTHAPRS
jgi:pimeloyl-ACP methyl ester carboxylesterase